MVDIERRLHRFDMLTIERNETEKMCIRDRSNVPFDVDYITWKIVDKKVAKRTAVQELSLIHIYVYKRQALYVQDGAQVFR